MTDPLVSLRSGTWPFTLANRQKVSAPFGFRIFLWTKVFYILKTAEINPSTCSISSSANSTSNSERASSFLATARGWSPQSLSHQLNKVLCHPSHPADFFATQILGGHVTSRNQSLSSNDQGRQRRETLGTRLPRFELNDPRLRSHGKIGDCEQSRAEQSPKLWAIRYQR